MTQRAITQWPPGCHFPVTILGEGADDANAMQSEGAMTTEAHSIPRRSPQVAPKPMEEIMWPIQPAALAALIDLGLSEGQIAAYFSVEPAAVRALRRNYGIDA